MKFSENIPCRSTFGSILPSTQSSDRTQPGACSGSYSSMSRTSAVIGYGQSRVGELRWRRKQRGDKGLNGVEGDMVSNDSMPLPESERREIANAHKGEILDEVAEVTPRRMAQMVSMRLEPEIVTELRQVANDRGVSMSDLLREGADCVINRWRGTRDVVHVSFSSSVFPGRVPTTGAYDVILHRVPASAAVVAPESTASL